MRTTIVIIALSVFLVSATSKRDCLQQWNLNQIGVSEATGSNDGIYVERYLRNCDLSAGYAWCACYAFSGHIYCGIPKIELPENPEWSPNWFPDERVVWRNGDDASVIKKGMVFGLYVPSKGRIAHVGFVLEVNVEEGYILTIEGNTSMPESVVLKGDGVRVRKRSLKGIALIADWTAPIYGSTSEPVTHISTPPPVSEDYVYHEVRKKETLYSLSIMYRVSVQQLIQWNDIQNNAIYIGQKLRVV